MNNPLVRDIMLGYQPREWQLECHKKLRRFTVLALHRRAGKTELALNQLIWGAAMFNADLGLFIYVAPFLKQAKVIAWARLKQRLAPLVNKGVVEVLESDLAVRFAHNGAIIRVFGADNPDAMRGLRIDGSVIDEVAQIKPEVWNDIIQPALADRIGWAMFIGTPSGVNLFSELYYRAKTLPDWYSKVYTVYDTEALGEDEVARLKRDMTQIAFAREMLCDFAAAGNDQLISIADIEVSMNKVMKPEEVEYAPRILGVDPARFGDDRSVIVKRQGIAMLPSASYRGIDNMALAALVAQEITDWKPDAVFIDAGQGSGVIDRLRQLGHTVIEVNFGGRSTDPIYFNKRTEMWFNIRDWLRLGGALPRDNDLRQDLAAPTYWYNAANKICLEPKDEIKSRGLPSPDVADALALTFAYPVVRQNPFMKPANQSSYDPFAASIHAQASADYDPFSNMK